MASWISKQKERRKNNEPTKVPTSHSRDHRSWRTINHSPWCDPRPTPKNKPSGAPGEISVTCSFCLPPSPPEPGSLVQPHGCASDPGSSSGLDRFDHGLTQLTPDDAALYRLAASEEGEGSRAVTRPWTLFSRFCSLPLLKRAAVINGRSWLINSEETWSYV